MGKLQIINKNSKEILLGLELLRFISALAILIWHYQHFAMLPNTHSFEPQQQPFYNYLSFFYLNGAKAVYLFWALSGYIFFYNYYKEIKTYKLTIYAFFIDRFSRLYPLHLVTLLALLSLQISFFSNQQEYFIYRNNDIYHFILNLFLINYWGFEKGYSFNGPVWSVSAEVLIYFIFFFTTLKLSIRNNVLALFGFLTAMYMLELKTLFMCAFFFYLGGILNRVIETNKRFNIFILLLIVFLLYSLELSNEQFIFFLLDYPNLFRDGFLCLLLLIVFLKIGFILKRIGPFISGLGNLTYSMYLCHFPIQLLIVLFFLERKIDIPYKHSLFFLFFIISTTLISFFVYKLLEKPAKEFLRRKLN